MDKNELYSKKTMHMGRKKVSLKEKVKEQKQRARRRSQEQRSLLWKRGELKACGSEKRAKRKG